MIDIHTHILPGIDDDGPSQMHESVLIAKSASKLGVRIMVATPHILNAPCVEKCKKILDTVDALNKQLKNDKINIEILPGAEFFLSPNIVELIKEYKELSINSLNKYMLIEFPFQDVPDFAEQVFFDLLIGGITPIIAHPERCDRIQKDIKRLSKFIQNGCLIQVNAGSLYGKYGKKSLKTVKLLLKKRMVHIIASDIHNTSTDHPFSKGIGAAAKIVGMDDVLEMISLTPQNIIN